MEAFTLIEILVVISIIALLAAILFPVFARARENARRASCQSNLKQIVLAVRQYTQDYDERFPLEDSTTVPQTYWVNSVMPYLKSWQVFHCPSYQFSYPTEGAPFNLDAYSSTVWNPPQHIGYAGSTWLFDTSTVADTFHANTVQQVQFATKVVMISDYANGYNSGANLYSTTTMTGRDGNGSGATAGGVVGYKAARTRHLGGGNFAFVDGHVKWVNAPEPWYAEATVGIVYNANNSSPNVIGYWCDALN